MVKLHSYKSLQTSNIVIITAKVLKEIISVGFYVLLSNELMTFPFEKLKSEITLKLLEFNYSYCRCNCIKY